MQGEARAEGQQKPSETQDNKMAAKQKQPSPHPVTSGGVRPFRKVRFTLLVACNACFNYHSFFCKFNVGLNTGLEYYNNLKWSCNRITIGSVHIYDIKAYEKSLDDKPLYAYYLLSILNSTAKCFRRIIFNKPYH